MPWQRRAIGFHVEVFEQAPELKSIGAGIALTTNGLRALHSLGVYGRGRRARMGNPTALDMSGAVEARLTVADACQGCVARAADASKVRTCCFACCNVAAKSLTRATRRRRRASRLGRAHPLVLAATVVAWLSSLPLRLVGMGNPWRCDVVRLACWALEATAHVAATASTRRFRVAMPYSERCG